MNERLLNETSLSAVTSATNGTSVNTNFYTYKTVWVNVSVNTGAVTVTIEASHDGTNWYSIDAKTYTAATGKDTFSYQEQFPMMRVTTSTQSNSTVSATITGRN